MPQAAPPNGPVAAGPPQNWGRNGESGPKSARSGPTYPATSGAGNGNPAPIVPQAAHKPPSAQTQPPPLAELRNGTSGAGIVNPAPRVTNPAPILPDPAPRVSNPAPIVPDPAPVRPPEKVQFYAEAHGDSLIVPFDGIGAGMANPAPIVPDPAPEVTNPAPKTPREKVSDINKDRARASGALVFVVDVVQQQQTNKGGAGGPWPETLRLIQTIFPTAGPPLMLQFRKKIQESRVPLELITDEVLRKAVELAHFEDQTSPGAYLTTAIQVLKTWNDHHELENCASGRFPAPKPVTAKKPNKKETAGDILKRRFAEKGFV